MCVYASCVTWTVSSTFAVDHFDLFGLRQAFGFHFYKAMGLATDENFTTRLDLHYCRHPIMFGFFMTMTCKPVMTVNSLIFDLVMSFYIVIAVKYFEEPDMLHFYPE